MSIGAGIALIVFGLVLLLGVITVDIPYVDERTLGVLLTLAGIACIVLTLTVFKRGSTTRVIDERRIEDDRP